MKKFDLQPFIDKVKELDIQMEGILVWQDGEELARHFFIPEYRRIQYSVSKSFTSAAVGFAQQEGLLCVQDPVLKYLADKAPAEPCENLQNLRLCDLLTMQSGMDLSKDMDVFQNYTEGDYVTYALSRPFLYAPGTTFAYDNMASYLLAFIVQRVTGQNLVDYLMPRLFGPLGIDRPEWDTDPAGNALGMSGLRINLSELFKFIKLYYDYGMLDGKQILPREWIEISTSALSDNAPAYPPETYDNRLGYGYQFWQCQHGGFRADGMYAKFGIVLRDKKAIICINAHEPRQQLVLDTMWETIYPQL